MAGSPMAALLAVTILAGTFGGALLDAGEHVTPTTAFDAPPRHEQWASLLPGTTQLTFDVAEAGPVGFWMMKRTGAELANVELQGMQECDGIKSRGVWIAMVQATRPPRELPICGDFLAGTHTIYVQASGSASVWAFWIEGATWSAEPTLASAQPAASDLATGQAPPSFGWTVTSRT